MGISQGTTGIEAGGGSGKCVLIQEREPSLRRLVELSLKKMGLETTAIEDFPDGAEHPGKHYDVVILEYVPRRACGSYLEKVRDESWPLSSPAVIVTTTCRPDDEWRRVFRPDVLLYKPFDIRYLEKKLLEVLDGRKEKVSGHQ